MCTIRFGNSERATGEAEALAEEREGGPVTLGRNGISTKPIAEQDAEKL